MAFPLASERRIDAASAPHTHLQFAQLKALVCADTVRIGTQSLRLTQRLLCGETEKLADKPEAPLSARMRPSLATRSIVGPSGEKHALLA